MANFIESAKKVLSVIQSHELYNPTDSEERLQARIESLAEIEKWGTCDPFVMIVDNVKPPTIYSIDGYDDCNTYQEEGYYKSSLEHYDKISEGNITLSNIQETWSENGMVKVSFEHNGNATELNFDAINGDMDMVPEEFTSFQMELVKNLVEKNKCIEIYGDGGFYYYFFPEELCKQLNQIKKDYIPSLS